MPHCAAVGCSNEAKNKRDPSISFHRVPLEGEISKKWLAAIGRPLSNLPKQPHLCSHHFEPHCFDESVDLWNRLMRDKPRSRELKPDAIPTIFANKPAPNVRTTSLARAAKRKRQEVRENIHFQVCNALLIRRDKCIVVVLLYIFIFFLRTCVPTIYFHCF